MSLSTGNILNLRIETLKKLTDRPLALRCQIGDVKIQTKLSSTPQAYIPHKYPFIHRGGEAQCLQSSRTRQNPGSNLGASRSEDRRRVLALYTERAKEPENSVGSKE